MKPSPFLLVGITDGSPQSQDSQTLAGLLANGLDLIYWRSPASDVQPTQFSPQVQKAMLLPAREAGSVPSPFRWHLKESDRQPLSTGSSCFSTSIHHLSEWPTLAGQAELVFYSPVFASISKPGYGPAVSLDLVAQQVAAIRRRQAALPQDRLPLLIGLGGVSADNVALLQQAGFDGAALMGALWQTPNAISAVRAIRKALAPEGNGRP